MRKRQSNGSGGSKWLLGAAAALAASAAYQYARAKRAERDNPPEGRFVTVDGVRLHYVERGRGDGPPVAILHGNGAMIADMLLSGLPDRLAERHRTVVFDRPGYGHSERPRSRLWTPSQQAALMAEALAKLGLERPIVLGHSWGALAALALGLEHPEAARGLVLLSGYYFPTARADVMLLGSPALPLVGDLMRYTISPALSRLLMPRLVARTFEPQPVPERFARKFPTEMTVRPWQLRASAEESAAMIPAAALQGDYSRLRLPAAILAGEKDRIVTPSRQSARLHRVLPDSTLRILPGLGHMIHHFAGDAIVEAVEDIAQKSETHAPMRSWAQIAEAAL